jgi:hypothetical protein
VEAASEHESEQIVAAFQDHKSRLFPALAPNRFMDFWRE